MKESLKRGWVIIDGEKYGLDEKVPPDIAAIFLGGKDKPVALRTLADWRANKIGPAFYRIGETIKGPVRYMVRDLVKYSENRRVENGNGARAAV